MVSLLSVLGAVQGRWGCLLVVMSFPHAMAMPVLPGTTGEFTKMRDRQLRGPLREEDRFSLKLEHSGKDT